MRKRGDNGFSGFFPPGEPSGFIGVPAGPPSAKVRIYLFSLRRGHRYSVIEGIPILLLTEAEQTHVEGDRALALAASRGPISLPQFKIASDEIDPFVKKAVGATNGSLYEHLVGNLREYPIPELRLPSGEGKLFLEIGCNWGRWSIAAARLGYRVVGIDPSLKAIRAARRVGRQLGIDALYVVGDGRHLPFLRQSFNQVFSSSVLQHLSKENARLVLNEVKRVLVHDGQSLIQMPNAFGIRCAYHQTRRMFREARDFEVRYWTPGELKSVFTAEIGPSELLVDGYFSLNAQVSDIRFMPSRYRALLRTSEFLRRASSFVPALTAVADSVLVHSSLH